MQDPDSESHTVISIHAPTRGATDIFVNTSLSSEFQSTLLQEERHVPDP